ncbi:FixH family protein [Candidatus Photodesmus blepharus]|uniref:FixH family protein n=1 Tax=Candidatus Photodesmus blepharonis TaxID=1179155 RepID=UPI000553FA3A|nr:FixH family protein [Candidatus Photodesmus blepharus]
MLKPWYKQFWPWFLIFFPLTSIIASVITIVIFSKNSVSLITDNYYTKAASINTNLSKIQRAKKLELSAYIYSEGKNVFIFLNKGQLEYDPTILHIFFTNRTLPDRDFSRLVYLDENNQYRLFLENELTGLWFIKVTPLEEHWIIQGKVNFPSSIRLIN